MYIIIIYNINAINSLILSNYVVFYTRYNVIFQTSYYLCIFLLLSVVGRPSGCSRRACLLVITTTRRRTILIVGVCFIYGILFFHFKGSRFVCIK